jgi:hypothetical protein
VNTPDVKSEKQDCEWKALFRLLTQIKTNRVQEKFTLLLDRLYADQCVVKAIQEAGHHFIIVAKPDDTKYIHEEFTLVTTKRYEMSREDAKIIHSYEWANDLQLNSSTKKKVSFVRYKMQKLVRPGVYTRNRSFFGVTASCFLL